MKLAALHALGLFLLAPASVFADEILVPGDAATIQGAIDMATDGDTVTVGPGTYFVNLDFLGKAIVLRSSGGAGVTVLDGGSSDSVIRLASGEGPGTEIEGFTIRNGLAPEGGGIYCGPDTFCTIRLNVILDCEATGPGGAIGSDGASLLVISSNVIEGNRANVRGGGISVTDSLAFIFGNAILDNWSFSQELSGAGVGCLNSRVWILDNLIEGNFTDLLVGPAGGGGIFLDSCFGSEIVGNEIIGNRSDTTGGGLAMLGSSDTLVEDNTIQLNTAAFFGGGIYCQDIDPIIRGNLIEENSDPFGFDLRGAGVHCSCQGGSIEENLILRNTVIDWTGGLRLSGTDIHVRSNLIAENAQSGLGCYAGTESLIEDCIVMDNFAFYGAGGVEVWASNPTIQNSWILSNTGIVGGILINSTDDLGPGQQPLVRNCLIEGNGCYFGWASVGGGGLFLQCSSPRVENCTIVNNEAVLDDPDFDGFGGGVYHGSSGFPFTSCVSTSNPLLIDCIVSGNQADSGDQIFDAVGSLTVRHSLVAGGWGGAGNLSGNPLLDANHRLLSGSPCIDTGDPATSSLGLDLGGSPRRLDGDLNGSVVIDMGAFEFDNVSLAVIGGGLGQGEVTLEATGTAGLAGGIYVGLRGGSFFFPPYGEVFLDLSGFVGRISSFSMLPSQALLVLPALPLTELHFQAVALNPMTGFGNLSNPVVLRLGP